LSLTVFVLSLVLSGLTPAVAAVDGAEVAYARVHAADDEAPSPTNDEDSPTNDEDSPTDDEDSPTDDEDSPTDDEDSPVADEDSPSDSEGRVAEDAQGADSSDSAQAVSGLGEDVGRGPQVSVAPPPAVSFAPTFQERVRFNYLSDRSFDGDLGADWSIGNRARVGLRASVGDVLGGFIQLQDVRNWGSEVDPSTYGEGSLTDWVANGLDVHQAYGEVKTPFGLSLRLGRQEIGWNAERLLGVVDWSDQGRALDAVRIRYDRADVVGMEVLYAKLLERPTGANDASERNQDMHLIGLGGGPRLGDPLMLDGLVLVRLDPTQEETMATFGIYAKGRLSVFSYEIEGYGQAGTRGEQSIGAYLVGLRVGANLPFASQPYIGGGVDLVSGDDDPTDAKLGSFDTLYGTNHNFYGHMDVYTDLSGDTAGGGLIDGQLNLRLTPVRPVSVQLDAHVFASPSPEDSSTAFHGVELDVEAILEPLRFLSIGTGVWAYFPGAFWGEDAKAELGAYLTTDFHFH